MFVSNRRIRMVCGISKKMPCGIYFSSMIYSFLLTLSHNPMEWYALELKFLKGVNNLSRDRCVIIYSRIYFYILRYGDVDLNSVERVTRWGPNLSSAISHLTIAFVYVYKEDFYRAVIYYLCSFILKQRNAQTS